MASEETDSSPVHYFLYLLHLWFPIMNITDWRRRMDEIDKKLVELLNERSQCALEVGKLKQAAGMPIY
ncbi:MAG TPA: chorismate mutase, partial [Terriglobales bacterium]|nr:chorismate mutase [Terriglobales bacterium]